MKKNTTYGAVALSLVLLLSGVSVVAMDSNAPGVSVLADVQEDLMRANMNIPAEQTAPEFGPAFMPDNQHDAIRLSKAAILRAKLASFGTRVKTAAEGNPVLNPFQQDAFVDYLYVSGLDRNSRMFKAGNWMYRNPKKSLAAYYAAVTAVAAGTTYAIYKLAPKVNAARKAVVAKAKAWYNGSNAKAVAPVVAAPVAAPAPVVKSAPVVTAQVTPASKRTGLVQRCKKNTCKRHR